MTSTIKKDEGKDRSKKNVWWPPHCSISFIVYSVEKEIILEAIYPRPSKPLLRVVPLTVGDDSISLEKLGSSWVLNKKYYLEGKKEAPILFEASEISN